MKKVALIILLLFAMTSQAAASCYDTNGDNRLDMFDYMYYTKQKDSAGMHFVLKNYGSTCD